MAAPTLPDVLQQDELWVGGQRVEDMNWKHRSNLIPFLRRGAHALYFSAYMKASSSELMLAEDPGDGVASAQAHLMAPFYHYFTPEDWLEQTPLMKKLVELEQGLTFAQRKWLAARNKAHEVATGYEKVTLRLK